MYVERIRNGKLEQYYREPKKTNYDTRKSFRLNLEEYKEFAKCCEKKGELVSSVMRNLMQQYVKECKKNEKKQNDID